ncbi:MAG TPA: hypothetical protein VIW92_13015 [Thermoanaerobaculia bacterium]
MKKIRLFALAGALGFTALTGAEASDVQVFPTEDFCMCGCPDGSTICVSSINGDCGAACAEAVKSCPSDM